MRLTDWYVEHGTKIIGFVAAGIGALEFADATTVKLIESALGPKLGPQVSHGILILAGLATAYRGYENSARIAAASRTTAPPQSTSAGGGS